MQSRMQVIVKPGRSLRDDIIRDLQKQRDPWLEVLAEKKRGRPQGWAKLRSLTDGHSGVINFEWDSDGHILICRAVTKRKNRPDHLLGDFLAYLLERHGRRISAINIQVK